MAGINKIDGFNQTSPAPHFYNEHFATATARKATGQLRHVNWSFSQDDGWHGSILPLAQCFAADGTTPATQFGTWGTLDAHWIVNAPVPFPSQALRNAVLTGFAAMGTMDSVVLTPTLTGALLAESQDGMSFPVANVVYQYAQYDAGNQTTVTPQWVRIQMKGSGVGAGIPPVNYNTLGTNTDGYINQAGVTQAFKDTAVPAVFSDLDGKSYASLDDALVYAPNIPSIMVLLRGGLSLPYSLFTRNGLLDMRGAIVTSSASLNVQPSTATPTETMTRTLIGGNIRGKLSMMFGVGVGNVINLREQLLTANSLNGSYIYYGLTPRDTAVDTINFYGLSNSVENASGFDFRVQTNATQTGHRPIQVNLYDCQIDVTNLAFSFFTGTMPEGSTFHLYGKSRVFNSITGLDVPLARLVGVNYAYEASPVGPAPATAIIDERRAIVPVLYPAATPSATPGLFTQNGALFFRGANGTLTQVAAA